MCTAFNVYFCLLSLSTAVTTDFFATINEKYGKGSPEIDCNQKYYTVLLLFCMPVVVNLEISKVIDQRVEFPVNRWTRESFILLTFDVTLKTARIPVVAIIAASHSHASCKRRLRERGWLLWKWETVKRTAITVKVVYVFSIVYRSNCVPNSWRETWDNNVIRRAKNSLIRLKRRSWASIESQTVAYFKSIFCIVFSSRHSELLSDVIVL